MYLDVCNVYPNHLISAHRKLTSSKQVGYFEFFNKNICEITFLFPHFYWDKFVLYLSLTIYEVLEHSLEPLYIQGVPRNMTVGE